MSKRVPGDDEPLNNAGNNTAEDDAAEHEASVQRAVNEARAREEAEKATQANQVAAQRRHGVTVAEGTIVVPPRRDQAPSSKYGPELPYPDGTPIVMDKKGARPTEGSEQATHVIGRVMSKQGWLVGRAIPVSEIQAGTAAE